MAPTHNKTLSLQRKLKKTLRIGSDFAGLSPVALAMMRIVDAAKLDIQVQHVFASDSKPCVKRLLELSLHSKPKVFYIDVRQRNVDEMEPVGIYSFTPPCKSFSLAGNKSGVSSLEGSLIAESVKYIIRWRPKMLLFENVAAMVETMPHKSAFATVMSILGEVGYDMQAKVINSKDYNLPHWRRRVYMIGVLNDHKRERVDGIKWWPDPEPLTRKLSCIVKRDANFNMHPKNAKSAVHRKNAKSALKAAIRTGINPFITPIVVDVGGTPGFMGNCRHWRSSMSMTLTETRCYSFGYWCSTKGDYLSVEEMAALQGYEMTIDYEAAGLSKCQYAGCLGAAQSLAVVEKILPHVLYMSRFIDKNIFEQMKAVV